MIKKLLNSVIAKYRDSVCPCLAELLATEKSRYFAQPRPIMFNYFSVPHDKCSDSLLSLLLMLL